MSRFSFLHAADIHLDSPMLNLDRYDGAPVDEFRGAVRRALAAMVDLAIAEEVRFVLIAGDLYDADCRDFNTPRFLRKQLAVLDQAGIDVFLIQGNHDAASRMEKAFRLRLPDRVHLFPSAAPATVVLDDVDVAIHGQSFAERSIRVDLAAGYPAPRAPLFNIGLLHTEIGGGDHGDYAPTNLSTLTGKGYDYWALGHIHDRKVVRKRPWIVYPGALQGRHIGETGAKGCSLVRVDGGRVVAVEPREVDVVRWQRCVVDASVCADGDAVLLACEDEIARLLAEADGRTLAVRVEVGGASPAHRELATRPGGFAAELRERVIDRFVDRVWLEKIELDTTADFAIVPLLSSDDPVSELLRALRRPDALASALAAVRADLDKLYDRLPADPRLDEAGDPPIDLDDPLQLDALADEIEQLLVPRLFGGGEPE